MTLVAGRRWWLFGFMDKAQPAVVLADPPGKSLVGTHPALADLLRRVHVRHPTNVNSARRDIAQQQKFFECAQAKKTTGRCPPGCEGSQCASANRPGTSNHEFGLAIDADPIDGKRGPWQAVVREEGGNFVIAKEPWHVQLAATSTGHFTGFPDDWRP